MEDAGHELLMDNYLSSLSYFLTYTTGKKRVAAHNGQGMLANLGRRTWKMTKRDIVCEAKGSTGAVCWKDKRDI
jgi:hypothetical protein